MQHVSLISLLVKNTIHRSPGAQHCYYIPTTLLAAGPPDWEVPQGSVLSPLLLTLLTHSCTLMPTQHNTLRLVSRRHNGGRSHQQQRSHQHLYLFKTETNLNLYHILRILITKTICVCLYFWVI